VLRHVKSVFLVDKGAVHHDDTNSKHVLKTFRQSLQYEFQFDSSKLIFDKCFEPTADFRELKLTFASCGVLSIVPIYFVCVCSNELD
jgi:hypothetical protein